MAAATAMAGHRQQQQPWTTAMSLHTALLTLLVCQVHLRFHLHFLRVLQDHFYVDISSASNGWLACNACRVVVLHVRPFTVQPTPTATDGDRAASSSLRQLPAAISDTPDGCHAWQRYPTAVAPL
jgi:hypothetical protein